MSNVTNMIGHTIDTPVAHLLSEPLPSVFVSFRSGLINHPLTSVHGNPLKTFDRQAEELQIYGFVDRRRNSLFSERSDAVIDLNCRVQIRKLIKMRNVNVN